MPRKKLGIEASVAPNKALADKLADELRTTRESGQPLIYERELRPERSRVVVIWDLWHGVPLETRTAVILLAYERAEGPRSRDHVALASGLTVPEATAAGMLPYQIEPVLRKADPVTQDQCWKAMLAEGASQLFAPNVVQLRFATEEEAEACRLRLIKQLPKSDDVWFVSKDVVAHDSFSLDDVAEAAY